MRRGRLPRLLVVGDAVAGTGFARVTSSIIDRLKQRYDIHQLGINYFGDPHHHDWPIYPAGLIGDPHGVARLAPLITRINPDVVLLVEDVWILARYIEALRPFTPELKVVLYLPIDAEPLDDIALIRNLGLADRLVVYNTFGESVLKQALSRAATDDTNFRSPPVSVVPHGVDTGTFFPMSATDQVPSIAARRAARSQLFPDREDLQDAFIVLNANRNQPRKRIDTTVKAFGIFSEGKPDNVKLYLHMGLEDVGWNLTQLARRFGVEDRLIISSQENVLPWVPIEKMNTIFNACNVGINTSTGEGWGLVSFEHAATGAAQIVPRHSACQVLWDGYADMVDPVFSLTNERVLTEAKLVEARDVAQSLDRLYFDHDHLRAMSLAAYRNATRPEYSWERIAHEWDATLSVVLSTTS